MDKSLFDENAPGELIRITYPHDDFAFIPNELPPQLVLDNHLWKLIVDARSSLAELNGIGQTLPNPNLLLRPLQTREALKSSSIEGTYVTPEELLIYRSAPREPKSSTDADSQEVDNYRKALEQGIEMLDSIPFGNYLMRGLHGILLTGVRGKDKSPGEYRNSHVQLGSDARFLPPPAERIQGLLDGLFSYINTETSEYDPLTRAFLVHYQFECIHPFKDGNGRMGRLLLALMISKSLTDAPWLYLSAFFDQHREEYVEKLFKVSTKGQWYQWIEFCLRAVIFQSHDSIKRCKAFQALKKEFHNRVESQATKQSHNLIEWLFEKTAFTVKEVAERFEISYNTAKKNVEVLTKVEILKEAPNTYPAVYYSPELLSASNDDN